MLSGSKSISLNSDGNYNSNGLKKKGGGYMYQYARYSKMNFKWFIQIQY